MALSFAELKKQRAATREKLSGEIAKLNTNNNNEKDDRFWYPETDKAGNGYAVIRFLPAPEGEDFPYVRLWQHSFQGPGGWYIENSLTTIGQQDPIAEYNNMLWGDSNIKDETYRVEERKQARKQKRKLIYISNVLIIKDPANPQNEGKVKLFKYGAQVFDKLNEAMNPPEMEGEEPMNPFDLWEGANFKIKIRQVEGYRNYTKSEFDDVEPLDEDDEVMEGYWKQCHSIQEQISPDKFKTYDQLKVALDRALKKNTTRMGKAADEDSPDEPEEDIDDIVAKIPKKAAPAKTFAEKKAKAAPKKAVVEDDEDDDEDAMNFLKSIAEDDD
jgi:hypothetical protein